VLLEMGFPVPNDNSLAKLASGLQSLFEMREGDGYCMIPLYTLHHANRVLLDHVSPHAA